MSSPTQADAEKSGEMSDESDPPLSKFAVIDLVVQDPRWDAVISTATLQSWANVALAHLAGLGRYDTKSSPELAILACDDARIAVLNADFRNKDGATNVLSWPDTDLSADKDGEWPNLIDPDQEQLGDIAIAYQTCAREATERDIALCDHVAHLVVHGVLHVLGFDHIRQKDATLMERIEVEILAKLAIDDPY